TRAARHYVNLSRTLPRMRQLIAMLQRRDARFMTASGFVDTICQCVTAMAQGRRVLAERSSARRLAAPASGDGLRHAPQAGGAMCGIVGIVGLNTSEPVDETRLKIMRDVLRHRGPDGEGLWTEGSVGLGFRRLAIIDGEGGAQPMSNEDGN